jgi:phage gpG-like protein
MAVNLTVSIEGEAAIRSWLDRLDPVSNSRIMRNGLIVAANLISTDAKTRQFVAGGRGKSKALKALSNRLTSRTGTLRRSIRVNRSGVPAYIDIGTDLKYGAVHEFGGEIDKPSRVIRSHTRRVAFGKKRKPFTVPAHFRMGHSANYPKRPFMKPALDAIAPSLPTIFLAEWAKEAAR